MANVSKPKLKRLQTLWGQYAKREILDGDPRAARLAWATEQLGRTIASFSSLSYQEADQLIEKLHGFLGIQSPVHVRRGSYADRMSRAQDGKKDGASKQAHFASTDDLARIDKAIERLGWTRDRFDAWMRSTSSPLGKKINGVRVAPSNPKIRTRAEANRVWWAMKGMLQRSGQWKS